MAMSVLSDRSHSLVRMFVAVAGLLAAAGVARAEDAPAAGAPAAAAAAPGHRSLIGMRCKDDAAKLCSGVELGGGKLARCLRLHDNDLSEPCKSALASADSKKGATAAAPGTKTETKTETTTEKTVTKTETTETKGPGAPHEWGAMKDMRKSCAADVGKFCKDVQPGHGRIADCLNQHTAELAPACKKTVETVSTQMNAHMEMHADCAADVQKLCSDVPAGSGRVAMCLGEHTKDLSPACKKHVDDMRSHWKKHMADANKAGGAGGVPGTAPAMLPPVPPAPAPAKK